MYLCSPYCLSFFVAMTIAAWWRRVSTVIAVHRSGRQGSELTGTTATAASRIREKEREVSTEQKRDAPLKASRRSELVQSAGLLWERERAEWGQTEPVILEGECLYTELRAFVTCYGET